MIKRKPIAQWTILELIFVLGVATIIIGAMYSTVIIAELSLILAMAILFGNLLLAIVGKGEWQTFAISFTAVVATYGALIFLIEDRMGPSQIHRFLPTTSLWMYLREPLTRRQFLIDDKPIAPSLGPKLLEDGRTIVDKDGTPLGVRRKSRANQTLITVKDTPNLSRFERTGYFAWLLLAGYMGGKFAVGFRRNQDKVEDDSSASGGQTSDGI